MNPWIAILAVSGILSAFLLPTLWGTAAILYLPFLILGSLYGSFNLVIFLRSQVEHRRLLIPRAVGERPKVALLYTTCNDFDLRALASVVDQRYANVEIVILDDSTREDVRAEVDRAAAERGVRVLRRPHRNGFKAGAINAALRIVDAEFLGIVDADEILPTDFVERALAYFTEPRVAFVQATHVAYNRESRWTRAMGHGVDLHWRIFQPYRNHAGVVNFLGHGALLRTSVVREVGGIPETVSEDIALTVEFASRGYRGVFAADIVCGEAFPATFSAFRRRHKKWAMGTADFLRRYLVKIITAPIAWYEKLDLILPVLSLPMTLLLFGFIVGVHFLPIPISVPLVAISALAVGSPLLPFLTLPRGQRLEAALINSLAFMALFTTSVFYVVRGAVGRATFLITGEARPGRVMREALADVLMGLVLIALHPFTIIGFVALSVPVLILAFDRPRDARSLTAHTRSPRLFRRLSP